jgi:hypothetical protein
MSSKEFKPLHEYQIPSRVGVLGLTHDIHISFGSVFLWGNDIRAAMTFDQFSAERVSWTLPDTACVREGCWLRTW